MEPAYKKNYMPNLFSWKDLEHFINTGVYLNFDKHFRYGFSDVKEDFQLNWNISPWHLEDNEIPISKFKEFIDTLSVFYFMDCSRVKKEFNAFCAELEELEGRPFDTHIFVHYKNLEKPHPFGCHYDCQSNVIVQCEGSTHWRVYPKVEHDESLTNREIAQLIADRKLPNTKMTPTEDPIIDVILEPGDAIWIPQFYPHHAISKEKRISISFAGYKDLMSNKSFYRDRKWITL